MQKENPSGKKKKEFIEERKSICDRPEAAGEICVIDDRISKAMEAYRTYQRLSVEEKRKMTEKAEEIIRSFEA